MNISHLILSEIKHRRLNFIMALVSVGVAVACLVGAVVLLRLDQKQTESILAQKQEAVFQAGAELEDAMRVITKGLGFNIIILPKDQDPSEMHLEGTLSRTMPESHVQRLADSRIVTVNHLLPTVISKMIWTEMDRPIFLYGTRGEVPLVHRDPKKPLLDAVPEGQLILGHQLSQDLNLSEGDEVRFSGRRFTILKTHEERGTKDDNTIWINLREAQEILNLENLIHAIQALECNCAGERITQIRSEITAILPGTQVIERGPPALARAEARQAARDSAEMALAQEKAGRLDLQHQKESLAAILIPVVLAGAAVWVGFLVFGNVRQRTAEIGILRAIGYRSGHIMGIVLGKAVLVGLGGAGLGLLGGILVGFQFGTGNPAEWIAQLVDLHLVLLALGVALGLSVLASWVPALLAAKQDPANILRDDS